VIKTHKIPAASTSSPLSGGRALMLQRQCASGGGSSCGGECDECKKKALQRQSIGSGEAGAVPAIVKDVLSSPGRPLDAETRAYMEPRFGHDFSKVRLHTDSTAVESARAVNANAYAAGPNIVFGHGQYAPGTSRGRGLLAHELTHVVQQSHLSGSVLPTSVGKADDPAEAEASRMASRIESPGPARLPDSGRSLSSTVRPDRSSALRRAVSVPDAASELKIVQEHSTDLKVQNLFGKWYAKPITPNAIKFAAKATASCGPGESAAGYEVGIVQVLTSEVNNGRYQGAVPADGSLWVRPDLPSVRPAGPCIDSATKGFWHDPKALSCNSEVSLTYQDFPSDLYPTILENSITKKPNYLKELHIAFEFITALALKRPDGSLQTLHFVRWSEGWDYSFDTPVSGESKVTKGLGQTGNAQFVAPMAAPAELPTRYAVPAKNCNTIDYEAGDNPARIQPSATW